MPSLKINYLNSNKIQRHQQHSIIIQQAPSNRKQTQISSIYTQLSSVKPLPVSANISQKRYLTNNGVQNKNGHKTVRTTQIGNIQSVNKNVNHPHNNNENSGNRIVNHKSSPELRSFVPISIHSNGSGKTWYKYVCLNIEEWI